MPSEQDKSKEYIAIDLDGTLAKYYGWKGSKHIGKPIPKMVNRVKRWLREGKTVKIFTARVAGDNGVARRAIQKYCKKVFGQVLPITNRKDQHCRQIWDDRAHNMKANTGDQMNKAAYMQGYMSKDAVQPEELPEEGPLEEELTEDEIRAAEERAIDEGELSMSEQIAGLIGGVAGGLGGGLYGDEAAQEFNNSRIPGMVGFAGGTLVGSSLAASLMRVINRRKKKVVGPNVWGIPLG